MTGFDPTAPARDTDEDREDKFPDNVVPPEELTDGPIQNDGETSDSADS